MRLQRGLHDKRYPAPVIHSGRENHDQIPILLKMGRGTEIPPHAPAIQGTSLALENEEKEHANDGLP